MAASCALATNSSPWNWKRKGTSGLSRAKQRPRKLWTACPSSLEMATQGSPHRPTAIVVPFLRAAINLHLLDLFPGHGAVQQANISPGGSDSGGGHAIGADVRWINSFANRPVLA